MTKGSILEPLLVRALNVVNDTALSNDDGNRTNPELESAILLEDSDDQGTSFNDSQVLRDTMMVYGSIMVVIILVFCWARRRFPKVYNLRNWVDPIKSNLAQDQHGFFSWMWKVYMVTEDELWEECGMDALCFVRIAQMGFKLA